MSDPDSGDLLLVAAGDAAALGRIASRWKGSVYAMFERTRDAASAAEATADVFDRLRREATRYQPGMAAGAFLQRVIAERILADAARPAEEIPPATLSGSAAARNAFVRAAVAALPPQERAAFLLTRVCGIPAEDAAAALHVSPAELQRLVVGGLALLRRALEPAAHAVPALAPVERHFGPETFDPPTDLDHRLAVRLATPAAAPHRFGRAAVAGVVIGAAVVAAASFLLTRSSAPRAAAPAVESAGATEAAVPAITRVRNAPVTVDTAPASEAEVREASSIFPPQFLLLVDSLAALDPLFPADAAEQVAGPPSPRPTNPPRAPETSPGEVGERISFLRHLPAAERQRIAALDGAYRIRPEAERIALWSRWELVKGWSEETLGGLRPLGRRLAALPGAERAALASEIRALRAFPREERLRRFRAHAFARGLTGQERAAAEAILS